MNGRDTVTLGPEGERRCVRFLGAGPAADLPPFTGAYEVRPLEGNEAARVRVGMDGLQFLWAADAALDAGDAAERIMRTVGLLCVEAHLAGTLQPDVEGTLQVRDFIGARYPDYTSVERFVGSLHDPPGRIERLAREDVLRCLATHAEEKGTEDAPAGPGLTVGGIRAWPGKRRFHSDEDLRDAILGWEGEGLVEWSDDRVRLRPDRLEEVRAILG